MTDGDIFRQRRLDSDTVPERLTLAVFNSDCPDGVVAALGEELSPFFDVESVTTGETLTDRDPEFAVMHDDVLIDGPILYGDRSVADVGGTVMGAQPADTVFVAGFDDRDGMRTLSQRIEKKAWWAGDGTLYATGHQRLSMMDDQWNLYESIADTGVNVTVFDQPEWTPGNQEHVTVRPEGSHAMTGTWLVVYDGAGNDGAKGALVATERGSNTYYGLWSVDPAVVDHLRERATEVEPQSGR
jgi:hypothetical protein